MKIQRIIVISCLTIFVFVSSFVYINDKKNKQAEINQEIENQAKVEKENEDKQVNEELSNLEIVPIVEKNESKDEGTSSGFVETSGSGTQNLETTQKSEFEITKEEKITILTFSNISECDSLTYLVRECKNKFIYTLAITNNNLSYCNRLSTRTEILNCMDEINYNNNNCEGIKNSILRKNCEYNKSITDQNKKEELVMTQTKISTNSDVCKTFSSYSEKENCLKNIIINTKDLNLCLSFFTDNTEKNTCYKNVSYAFNRAMIAEAFEKNDLSICNYLTVESLKTQCKSMKF